VPALTPRRPPAAGRGSTPEKRIKPPSLLQRLLGSNGPPPRPGLSRAAVNSARRAVALCHALISERGEVSGARLAREALGAYAALDEATVALFFDLLVEEFSPDPEELGRAAERYRNEPTQPNCILLQQAAEPPRQELFRRLNMAPGGTEILVDMHRKVVAGVADNPPWLGIDVDFVHLLRSWFNRGFLSLQRIDWRTSASILEKLIAYEAVHAIQGWHDLRRRLQADRRCYAFFHPALPEEPLVFIEIALTRGMSATVQPLLDPDSPVRDPASADSAMFYSITNCQQGLRGVSFGNFLIKQVAEDLSRELPRIRRFATISPIPGFRGWLSAKAESIGDARERAALAPLLDTLASEQWQDDGKRCAELERKLAPLCAYYLLHAEGAQGPADAVSRFHLANGARMERLNWMADRSAVGLRQSAGMMVNYVYRLDDVEGNHEAYARHRTIVASHTLRHLAKQAMFARERGPEPPSDGQGANGEPGATDSLPSQ